MSSERQEGPREGVGSKECRWRKRVRTPCPWEPLRLHLPLVRQLASETPSPCWIVFRGRCGACSRSLDPVHFSKEAISLWRHCKLQLKLFGSLDLSLGRVFCTSSEEVKQSF